MTKVSVIIPLYNSARFLPTLFENIAQQTIAADCEFVFIDDHGGDDSLAVARSLAASSGLRCAFGATEANGGPGAARNVGLKMAGGEYVAFLDSDDALDAVFCEKLYSAAAASDADLAYCHILAVKGGGSAVWRNPAVASGYFSGEKRLYFLKRYKSYFTSFIYRRAMLEREGIAFPPTRSAEDSCFLTCALLCASRIAFVDEPLYIYQLRSDSLSFGRLDDRYMQRMASFDALLEFARRKGLYYNSPGGTEDAKTGIGPRRGAGTDAAITETVMAQCNQDTDSLQQMLEYLYIKKATVGALRNNRQARHEILAHTDAAIPGWRRNSLYRRDLRLRAALLLL